MRRAMAVFTLAACTALTQTPPPLHLTGIVVDTNGKPVIDASIDHTGNQAEFYRTDANGRR